MAYVRRRTTKGGSVSTALVEAYRDARGQPRQRLLANLHGEPDTLRGLARLIFQRAALRKHRAEQWAEVQPGERDEEWVAAFFAKIDGDLAALAKDIAIVEKHCTATAAEIRAAIKEHERALKDAEAAALGSLLYVAEHENAHKALKTALRRLRS
jgi:hypothetical protein